MPYVLDARVADNSTCLGKLTIILPCPDEARYFMLVSYSPVKFTLPVWSSSEVRGYCRVMWRAEHTRQHQKSYNHSSHQHQVRSTAIWNDTRQQSMLDMYGIFGGVPRSMFATDRGDALMQMRSALDRWGAYIASHFYAPGYGVNDLQPPVVAGESSSSSAMHRQWSYPPLVRDELLYLLVHVNPPLLTNRDQTITYYSTTCSSVPAGRYDYRSERVCYALSSQQVLEEVIRLDCGRNIVLNDVR